MKRKISSLNILQTGKFLAVFYGLFTLIIVPIFLLASLGNPQSFAVMIPMLLIYPMMGFIGGVLMAAFYNLTAKWIGGIEVTVEDQLEEI